MTDIINEEENTDSLPEEEQESVVVDNGQTYASSETAVIAQQAAEQAKLWAQESERQANLSSGSATTAVDARDDAIEAKEYAEAAITDTNLITVATDLQSTPSNIKTVATNISNVNTVAGVSSDVTTVAGISSNVTTVAGISSNVTAVATSISNVNKVGNDISNVNDVADDLTNIDNVAGDLTNIDTVAGVSSEVSTVAGISNNVTTVAGISSNVSAVAGNASNINAVAGNNANITAVAGNATNINAVNANKTNIDTVAGDKTNIDTVAGISTAVSTVADNDTNITTVATNISDISTTATNISAINTNAANITDIQNASSNAALAKQYAVGLPTEPQEKSAKWWAEYAEEIAQAIGDPANRDLSNLNSTGKNIANWSTNVTNCITEIPQDIKLELNNGTLTLKAGSKVYVPNGAGVFDTVTIPSDKTYTFSGSSTVDVFLLYNYSSETLTYVYVTAATSGKTAPTGSGLFYNTTNNVIKYYTSGTPGNYNYAFPLAVIGLTNGVATEIKQVFNGIGFIGSTFFVLNGVKCLIADGRNADGTLKSIEYNFTATRTKYDSGNFNCDFVVLSNGDLGTYTHSNTKNYPNENFYLYGSSSYKGLLLARATYVDGKITNFSPRVAFQALDYSDTSYVTGLIDLLYPVGSIYIGTTATCPLAAIKGTWTLRETSIVTSVNTSVPVKGTGMSLGMTDGTNYFGTNIRVEAGAATARTFTPDANVYGSNNGTSSTNSSSGTANKAIGVTTNSAKSGIVGTVTRSLFTVNIWERTA